MQQQQAAADAKEQALQEEANAIAAAANELAREANELERQRIEARHDEALLRLRPVYQDLRTARRELLQLKTKWSNRARNAWGLALWCPRGSPGRKVFVRRFQNARAERAEVKDDLERVTARLRDVRAEARGAGVSLAELSSGSV